MSFIVTNSRFLLVSAVLVDSPVWLLPKWHTWNCLGKTGTFHPKLLINFFSLSIVGQIDWHAFGNSQDRLVLRWSQADLRAYSELILPACYVPGASTRFCTDRTSQRIPKYGIPIATKATSRAIAKNTISGTDITSNPFTILNNTPSDMLQKVMRDLNIVVEDVQWRSQDL